MSCVALDCGVPDPSLVSHATFSCSEGTTFLKLCAVSCVPPAKLQGTVWPAGPACSSLQPLPLRGYFGALSFTPVLFPFALLCHPLLMTPAESRRATPLFVPTTQKGALLGMSSTKETKALLSFCLIVFLHSEAN